LALILDRDYPRHKHRGDLRSRCARRGRPWGPHGSAPRNIRRARAGERGTAKTPHRP